MLIALTLTLLLTGFVLRRLMEPACPSCSGKSWGSNGPALICCHCGWSTAAASTVPAPESSPAQYEIGLH